MRVRPLEVAAAVARALRRRGLVRRALRTGGATCSCEHKRPIFVPKGYDDVVSVGYEDGTNEEIFGCVCEVAPWEQPWAGADDDGSSSED